MNARKLVPLLLVIAGLLAYQNSFTAPFVFDDTTSILENDSIRHLWPLWGPLSPPQGRGLTVEGRPVVNFTLAINYALGGVTPWGYHALNLAIHILAGLTLLGIVRRTLLRPAMSRRFGAEATSLALAIAVIWTVHPLQTEAVTYVAQRAESLMGLFYLLTMYCFVRGVESGKPGRWYGLSVTGCLLGMASKEVMVTAPAMVLLYDWMFVAGGFREVWKRRWRLYAGLAGTWAVLGYLVATTSGRGGTAGFESVVAWWPYALTQCRAVVHYLKLSVWPYPLVFDYGTATVNHVGQALPYALVLAALMAGTAIAVWRQRPIGFLGVWFFAILAPTSSVVPVATQTMAEHRMYLPLAAVVTLVALGGFELGRSVLRAWHPTQRMIGWGVTGALVLILAILTMKRNDVYSSEVALWRDTAEKYPSNPRAHYALGIALGQAGRVGEAIRHYEQALRIKPDYVEAHYNLGIVLEQAGRVPEAREHYEQALRIKPDYAEAHNNLGNVFLQEGKVSDAIGHYEQALQIKPDYADAHNNLGLALARLGRLQEAVGHWEQALRIKPDYAEAHCYLGIALGQSGRVGEAIRHLEQALRIKPDFTQAQNALARLQAGQ